MTKAVDKTPRKSAWAGPAADVLLFCLFFGALLNHLLLRSPSSGWAALSHLLLGAGLLLLAARHYAQNRPPLYWSHFDAAAIAVFIFLLVNVYYSEITGTSWRSTGLFLNALAGFFFGRLLFYRRLTQWSVVFALVLVAAYVAIRLLTQGLLARTPVDEFYLGRLEDHSRLVAIVAAFWLATLPFMLMRRPTNLRVLIYGAIIVGGYALYLTNQLAWMFDRPTTTAEVTMRQQRLEVLDTVWRIVSSHPLVGGGLGTFPNLFEAFKPSPRLPFDAAFSAYLYLLAETGFVGFLIVLYPLVRFPIYIARHWGFFPNRKLRMGVLAFLSLVVLIVFEGLHNPVVYSPAAWLILWTAYGTLSSLVMIRDPARIYPSLFGAEAGKGAQAGPVVSPVQARRRFGLEAGMELAVYTGFIVTLVVLQVAPYAAVRYSRERGPDDRASADYGRRLEAAAKNFPFLPELQVRLASYYQDKSATPLEAARFSKAIEQAYLRAVRLDAFEPRTYERLALVYTSGNNPAQAINILSQGTQNNPNDLWVRMQLVRELEKKGSYALATWHVKQALFRVAPEQTELYLRLAELYDRRGLKSVAVRYYQMATQVLTPRQLASPQARRLRERLGLAQPAGA